MNPLETCKPLGEWLTVAPWKDRSVSLLVIDGRQQAFTLAGKRAALSQPGPILVLWTGRYKTDARAVDDSEREASVNASPDLVSRFMEWSDRDRNRSPNTLSRYREVIASLADIADPIAATIDDLDVWWESRIIKADGDPRAPGSRANELACLRAFYKWASRFDHRADDPTRRLEPPKVPIRVPRPIGKSEMEKLIREAPDDLMRAFALGAYGGMRVAEAASADWSWIDDESRRIYILGKGNKQRLFSLSVTLNDLIMPRTGGNIVTAGAAPYSGAQLQRRINRYMKTRTDGRTYHDIRKRGAALAIEKTGDPVAVTKAYGWSDVNTAMHYHETSNDMLDRIADALT